MNRQVLINSAIGGVMAYTSFILWKAGHPGLGIVLYLAWAVGMVNSLIPHNR